MSSSRCLDKMLKSVEAADPAIRLLCRRLRTKTLESVLLRSRVGASGSRPRSIWRRAIRARCSLRHAGPAAGASPARPRATCLRASCSWPRNCSMQSSATSIDTPGWGHAEAYLALGRELQARGDQLGARNWIEKSLIAAPDYKAAQRQLALLVRRALGLANLVSFGAMKPQGTQLSLFETRSSSDPFAVRVSPRARRLTARVHVGRPRGNRGAGRRQRSCSARFRAAVHAVDRPQGRRHAVLCRSQRAGAAQSSSSPSPARIRAWNGAAAPTRSLEQPRRPASRCRLPDERGARADCCTAG